MSLKAAFDWNDADRAGREWSANCGPGAVAAVLDTTLEAIRPHLGDFEKKHYTNPSLMYQVLRSLGVRWITSPTPWPANGLVRVQWEGPWTDEGQPWAARQRHTHWIASRDTEEGLFIFDINCICVGGWVPIDEWTKEVVPWLLPQVEPKAYGTWHPTHKLHILSKGIFS